jgi:hypothetical protein
MAAGSTYTPIATYTAPSSQSSVTFSSISGSYTDLIMVVRGTASTYDNHYIRVGNGSLDTGTNYSATTVYGDGSSAGSERLSNWSDGSYVTTGGGPAMTTIINFMNYSNTTTYKSFLTRGNNMGRWVTATAGLWRSTSAINTIQYRPAGGTIDTGTTFTLYGIASA